MLITSKKDPTYITFKELDTLKNRISSHNFIIEGSLLTGRAINDGLSVQALVYTERFVNGTDTDGISGKTILAKAQTAGINIYNINEGLLSSITSTRPLPSVLALCHQPVYSHINEIPRFKHTEGHALIIIDRVSNPDNLGMILRTADAAGIGGIAVLGSEASVYHKNCIRAARGAMGRLPVLACQSDQALISHLKESGFIIIGTGAQAECSLYQLGKLPPHVAFVVGNESHGIRNEILALCDKVINIPMVPGRDSLSVPIAAGVVTYEWVRQKACQQPQAHQ